MKVYEINYDMGNLTLVDIVRPEIDSAVREVTFSKDGKYMYAVTSLNSSVEVYRYYLNEKGQPEFERVQVVSVLKKQDENLAATSISLSDDDSYVFVGVDASNTTSWLSRDSKTGMLTLQGETSNSGEFPKDIDVLPGGKILAVLNHDTNELRTLRMNYEKNYALMVNAPVKVSKPNCIKIHKLG